MQEPAPLRRQEPPPWNGPSKERGGGAALRRGAQGTKVHQRAASAALGAPPPLSREAAPRLPRKRRLEAERVPPGATRPSVTPRVLRAA
eukprot:scaffold212448_cov31-Tisochrysis_lutea.AAC.5